MGQLKLNSEELSSINKNVRYNKEELAELFTKISNDCAELSNYVRSDALKSQLADIRSISKSIMDNTTADIEELSQFLDRQLIGYEDLVSDAVKMLKEALEFINKTFGSKEI